MVELVEYIAKSLIDHPECLQIETHQEGDTYDILLKVAPEDMGKIIGRQGKIAKAIRSILKAVSLKEHIKVNLDIEELK